MLSGWCSMGIEQNGRTTFTTCLWSSLLYWCKYACKCKKIPRNFINLFQNFWIPYIRNESELLCFAASKSLKCVLRKVVALEENSLKFPDSYWSSLSDKERVLNQISSVEKVLPILISSIHSLAGLDSNLRLMVVNTELLLLYQTFWGNTSSEDRNKHIFTILKNFSLMNEAEIPNGQPKNVTKITKKAQFVRSTLLSSVHSVLPRFIVTCELDQMVCL